MTRTRTRPATLRRPLVPAVLTAIVLAGSLAACTGQANPPGEAVTPTSLPDTATRTGSASPSASSSSSQPAPVTGVPSDVQVVTTGLPLPWSIVAAPGDGWLVSLRDEAQVLHLATSGEAALVPAPGPGGTVPGVVAGGEGGLLGLALRADQLYAYTTTQVDGRTENAVVRMTLSGAAASGFSLGAPQPVLTGIPGAAIHNGGRMAFGPDDMLYVTTGDARNTDASQDPASLGGKILRLAPDGEPAPGNPDPTSPVWTLGHRNVQGIGWDAEGRMFASEFGQNRLDELNLIEPGNNYGWPEVEGAGGAPEFTDPLVTWATSEASPSGLVVTGDAVYLAALRGQRLWRVPLATGSGSAVVGAPEPYFVGAYGRLRDVVVDTGSLLVLTNNTPAGADGSDDQLLRVTLR